MLTLPPVVGMSNVLKLSLRMTGMQCSGPTVAGLAAVAAVHLGRGLHGLRIDRDDGVQGRTLHVVGCDPVEIEPGQLRAGQLSGGERSVDAGDRRLLETERTLLRTRRQSRKD